MGFILANKIDLNFVNCRWWWMPCSWLLSTLSASWLIIWGKRVSENLLSTVVLTSERSCSFRNKVKSWYVPVLLAVSWRRLLRIPFFLFYQTRFLGGTIWLWNIRKVARFLCYLCHMFYLVLQVSKLYNSTTVAALVIPTATTYY